MQKLGFKTYLILILTVLVVGTTGWYVYNDYNERQVSVSESNELATSVVKENNVEGLDSNLTRQIDFDALEGINSSATRWLYIPGTPTDAVVCQEQIPEYYYYNYMSVYGTWNGCGEFLVPAHVSDKEDAHLIILGHRMNGFNGEWMFSNLPIRYDNEESAKQYQYIYVYERDKTTRYKVWCAADLNGYDMVYQTPYELKSDDYQGLLDHVEVSARYQLTSKPNNYTNTVMLSTCQDNIFQWQNRFAVFGVAEYVYYPSTGEVVSSQDIAGYEKWVDENNVEANDNLAKIAENTEKQVEKNNENNKKSLLNDVQIKE